MTPDAEPISLPVAQVYKQSLGWSCSFSACSTYVALTYNPGLSFTDSISRLPDHSASDHSASDGSASDCSESDCSESNRSASNRSASNRSASDRSASDRSALDYSAELQLFRFSIQDKVYSRCNTSALSLLQYDSLTVDFHPQLPELVLNSFASPMIRGASPGIDEFKTTTQLLNLQSGTLTTLDSPTIYETPMQPGERSVTLVFRD